MCIQALNHAGNLLIETRGSSVKCKEMKELAILDFPAFQLIDGPIRAGMNPILGDILHNTE